MAFWNRKRENRALSTLSNPDSELRDALLGPVSASGKRVTVDNALGLAPVWAAVRLISESVGQLPLKVYRDIGDGEREEAKSHRSWRLLHDRPNSQTPAGRFWSTVAVHLLLYGNCFIEKRRDEAGIVDELWLLPPDEVAVKWWPRLMQKTYVLRDKNGRGEREFDDEDLVHIFGTSSDGLTGMSVIDVCRSGLGTALARDEFEGKFYANGAVLSQAIVLQGRLRDDTAIRRLKDSMVAIFGGSGKAHQIGVFEDGAEPRTVGSPLKDLEFVASQNMTRTDIAIMFNLPPNKLGGSTGDGLTYATVEMNQTAIAVDAIAPLAKTISDALSQDPSLMPQNIHWAEFTLEGMLRADASTRAEFYEKLAGVKAITADEIRKRENLPPLTDAQKKELNPAPPPKLNTVPQDGETDTPPMGLNGNGNGAMPAIQRS